MEKNFQQNQQPFKMSAQGYQQNTQQAMELQFDQQNQNGTQPYNRNNDFHNQSPQQGMLPNPMQSSIPQMRSLSQNQPIIGNGYQNYVPLQNRQDQYQQFDDYSTQNARFDNQGYRSQISPLLIQQPQSAMIQYPPQPQFPMNSNFFPQSYTNSFQNNQLNQLNIRLSELQNQYDNLQMKNDNLEAEKRRFQKSTQQIKELKDELNDKINQIDKLEEQRQQLSKELRDSKRTIQQLQSQMNWQADKIQELEAEKQFQQQYLSRTISQGSTSNIAREMELQSQIDHLNRQNQNLREQITRSQGEKETQFIQKIQKLEDDLKELEENRELFVKENQELKLSIKKNEKQKQIDDESINNLTRALQEKSNFLKESQLKIENQESHIQFQEEKFQKLLNDLKNSKGRGQDNQVQQMISQTIQETQQRKQQYEMQQKQDEEKKRREIENRKKIQQEKQIQQEKEKSMKVQRAKQLQQKMQESHGQMDVCFLVDVTQSMDKLKQQTQNCIKESIKQIKKVTGRDVYWAAVCYKDRLESKTSALYESFDFTKNSKELEEWLEKISCTGGGDQAEDIRGAIKDMCKLEWERKFRLAILITDAPCHGNAYHEPEITDNHKREDITNELKMLIERDILLIGINFFKSTRLMYEKFKSIYQELNQENLLMVFQMENEPMHLIAQKLVEKITEGAQQATQTNCKETKSKKKEVNQNKDGAIEALCKLNNFMNFEQQPGVQLIYSSFDVFRIELSEDSFERNLKTIQFIQVPNDFQNHFEGKWECIRTKNPFAYGQMKAVFLMKKKESTLNELYVVKTPKTGTPYTTLNEAIQECKSHLICQKLINKFFKDLEIAKEKKQINKFLQKMIYSDFLILQESSNAFWIAERFLNGTFVKYNNNFGYINDDETDLNRIAQAFTYYTFFISDFQYMVNDVQGVNIYLTDPAINTKKGEFDETDMGEEGQSMFIANFKVKKYLCLEILQILGIEENGSKTQMY